MKVSRFAAALVVAFVVATGLTPTEPALAQGGVTKYVRYQYNGSVSYGILEGDTIRELRGNIFESAQPTGRTVKLSDVKLLVPVDAHKVIAAGLNYRSHLGNQQAAKYPGLFAKYPTSLIADGENIVYYDDATDLHFEGEMVLVIGKRAKNVSVADAPSHIFGVTVGNDVSERVWQRQDLQWFRAKGADTFGPIGPAIARGINYNDLLLQTRLNGEVKQSQRTRDLIFDSATLVSYISKYVTLEPGDIVFTGTPGATSAMKPGDVVEIELEGVGVLRNRIVKEGRTTNEQ